jgi:hypothetical protein
VITMDSAHRRTTKKVGVILVHVDGMGNPYRFTNQDGTEAGCICQQGIQCEYHLRTMAEKARPAGTSK